MEDKTARDKIRTHFQLSKLSKYGDTINEFAWSPDGRLLALLLAGGTIDLLNTEDFKIRRKLKERFTSSISCLGWSPDGLMLSVGLADGSIILWDIKASKQFRTLREAFLCSSVNCIAWSPDGRSLAAGLADGRSVVWSRNALDRHENWPGLPLGWAEWEDAVLSLAWSPDSRIFASASGKSIQLWYPGTRKLQRALANYYGSIVLSLVWSPDGRMLASGSSDGTIVIWNLQTGQPTRILEGHTAAVTSLSFSSRGDVLGSLSKDGSVRVWESKSWKTVAVLDKAIPGLGRVADIAFNPKTAVLGLIASNGICTLDFEVSDILAAAQIVESVNYSNAKVVLVGDAGVGKSALGLVLGGNPFVPTESTHGHHVWKFDSREVELDGGGKQTREILLWDLAGQPGYRVFHQLHLNEVAIALVLFDSRSETDPFAGVAYWARALDEATRGFPLVKFLIASRIDRGGPPVSSARVGEVVRRYGFTGCFETSAKRGDGVAQVANAIHSSIKWKLLPVVTAPELFRDVKAFLVKEKETGHVLAGREELLERYRRSMPDREAPEQIFDVCLGRLEAAGFVKRLTFGSLVLLQPEMLDDYCAWLALAARREPDGLGFYSERRVLDGDFPMDTERRLKDRTQERLMLVATVEEVVGRGIAVRQPTQQGEMLVFPSEVRTDMPDYPGDYVRAISFRFEGPVKVIYATLAVSLIHSPAFTRGRFFSSAAVFRTVRGQICGFVVDYPEPNNDALGRLTVFFEADTEKDIKLLFLRFVNQHLGRLAFTGSVGRERVYQCACRYVIPEDAVQVRRGRGETTAICPVCGRHTPIDDLAEESAERDERVDLLQAEVQEEQRRQMRKAVLTERERASEFHVFLCHNSKDKPEVRQLAAKLRGQGILPWIDEEGMLAGDQFVPELEKVIDKVLSVAVIVGPHWMGRWQKQEYPSLPI